jgi:hypothetical protein
MEQNRRLPLQFGLASLFGMILILALMMGAWRFGGWPQALAWLPVEILLGGLAVEAAAWTIPRIIEICHHRA